MSKPPLTALAWMVLNEIEQSSARLPDLFHGGKAAEAQAELRDVIAVHDWLTAMGVETADHYGARLSDDQEEEILAWAAPPTLTPKEEALTALRDALKLATDTGALDDLVIQDGLHPDVINQFCDAVCDQP